MNAPPEGETDTVVANEVMGKKLAVILASVFLGVFLGALGSFLDAVDTGTPYAFELR
jgi:hypothetical protein